MSSKGVEFDFPKWGKITVFQETYVSVTEFIAFANVSRSTLLRHCETYEKEFIPRVKVYICLNDIERFLLDHENWSKKDVDFLISTMIGGVKVNFTIEDGFSKPNSLTVYESKYVSVSQVAVLLKKGKDDYQKNYHLIMEVCKVDVKTYQEVASTRFITIQEFERFLINQKIMTTENAKKITNKLGSKINFVIPTSSAERVKHEEPILKKIAKKNEEVVDVILASSEESIPVLKKIPSWYEKYCHQMYSLVSDYEMARIMNSAEFKELREKEIQKEIDEAVKRFEPIHLPNWYSNIDSELEKDQDLINQVKQKVDIEKHRLIVKPMTIF